MKHRIDIFPADTSKNYASHFFNDGIEAMNFLAKTKFNADDRIFLLKYSHTDLDGKEIYNVISQIETF